MTRLISILCSVLLASRYTSARPDDEDQGQSATITDPADFACATGESQSKYDFCASSISSKIDKCETDDLGCACSLANSGFSCLTSYCPEQTKAVCAGSLVIDNLCHLANVAGPTITHLTCPSNVPDLLASLLSRDILFEIPSDMRSFLPSDISNRMPSNLRFSNAPEETASSERTTTKNARSASANADVQTVPSQAQAASSAESSGKAGDGLKTFLGLGAAGSVAIGMLAAYI